MTTRVQGIKGSGPWGLHTPDAAGAEPIQFVLENALDIGAFVMDGVGVPFPWDSLPVIDDAGDWALIGAPPAPAVVCNRAGRYEVRYGIAGSETEGVAAYILAFCNLNAVTQPAGYCQFDVGGFQAATWEMTFILNTLVGDVLDVLFQSGPAPITIFASMGAQLAITRFR